MSEPLPGYHDIPEADQKKAQVFFERGKTVADTGNYEYAIDMYLEGLKIDPDSRDAHQELWEISMRRKASGGKPLGMMDRMSLKRPTKDDRLNMINAEKLLAYDPGETDYMEALIQNAHKAGFYDTVMWIGPNLLRANADSKKPDQRKFLVLKDIYKDLRQWKLATEACHYALRMNPDDMDLQTELKNLGAWDTMEDGQYLVGGSFRDSIRDLDGTQKLIDQGRDIVSADVMQRNIAEAEGAYKTDPVEGKLLRLVEQLEKTEDLEYENHAIELLEEAYARTRQFRFRQRVGKLQIAQMNRNQRMMAQAVKADPNDARLREEYEQMKREQVEFELKEYQLWAENYPTDLTLKFRIAELLYELRRYDEAIPMFQQARSDPKLKFKGSLALGRSFREAGYVDEAVDTLQSIIDEYQLKGDDLSKEMHYWQGRALEEKGNKELALKRYSQVAMWDFSYRDVQARIKSLRSPRP